MTGPCRCWYVATDPGSWAPLSAYPDQPAGRFEMVLNNVAADGWLSAARQALGYGYR